MKATSRNARRAVKLTLGTFACGLALVAGFAGLRPALAQAGDMVPLPLKLPKAVFMGTASNKSIDPKVEPLSKTPRALPMVPKGTVNLALHKKVTSGIPPFSGNMSELDLVTDGDKEAREDAAVELKPKPQWIQIDLGESSPLSYVAVWHTHMEPVVYHSVVVQVSNDPKFVDGVTTVFNNDQENLVGQGIGKDREYVESNEGKLIDAKSVKARYVRLWSKGSTYRDQLNRYTEVEVYGVPAK